MLTSWRFLVEWLSAARETACEAASAKVPYGHVYVDRPLSRGSEYAVKEPK